VQVLAARALESPDCHGVSVAFDPAWLSAWERFGPLGRYPGWDSLYWQDVAGVEMWESLAPTWVMPPPDVSWRPRWAQALAGGFAAGGSSWPLLLQVHVLPGRGAAELRRTLDQAEVAVRYLWRPLARTFGSAGSVAGALSNWSVGSEEQRLGTLGGMVDVEGRHLGLTCGHVLTSQEAAFRHYNKRPPEKIGPVLHSCMPAPMAAGPLTPDCCSSSLDMAIVELSEFSEMTTPPYPPATRNALISGSLAQLVGKKSGRPRHLRIAEYDLALDVAVGDTSVRMTELIGLHRISRYWGVAGTFAPPAQPGDSGRWLLSESDQGTNWAGMLVAGSGPSAYASFAESLFDHVLAVWGRPR